MYIKYAKYVQVQVIQKWRIVQVMIYKYVHFKDFWPNSSKYKIKRVNALNIILHRNIIFFIYNTSC